MKALLVCAVVFSVALSSAGKGDDKMVLIPAGVLRGVDPDFGEVALTNSKAFLMDKTEVTEAFFMDVLLGSDDFVYLRNGEGETSFVSEHDHPATGVPFRVSERDHPASGVSFRNAVLWCNARSRQEGLTLCYLNENKSEYLGRRDETIWCDFDATGYRLPTSDEWEYAARAGECTRFPWGDTICFTNANYTGNKRNSWDLSGGGLHPVHSKGVNVKDLEQATSPVMSFPPNRFGLYDMIGNVSEWCWPDNKTELKVTWGTWLILRGGCWRCSFDPRTGAKAEAPEEGCYHGRMIWWQMLSSGFRCVRKAPEGEPQVVKEKDNGRNTQDE